MYEAQQTDFEQFKQHIKKNVVPQSGELLDAYYKYKEQFYDYASELDDTKQENKSLLQENERLRGLIKDCVPRMKDLLTYEMWTNGEPSSNEDTLKQFIQTIENI